MDSPLYVAYHSVDPMKDSVIWIFEGKSGKKGTDLYTKVNITIFDFDYGRSPDISYEKTIIVKEMV